MALTQRKPLCRTKTQCATISIGRYGSNDVRECLVDDSSAVYGGCLRSVWVCMCVAVGVHVYVYVYVCGCVRVWCSGEMGTDFHLL